MTRTRLLWPGIALASFAASLALGDDTALDRWFYDRLHRDRAGAPDPRLALVYIGDRDIEAYGRWPWRNRAPHTAAIERLGGAAAIGLDVLFSEPSFEPDDDTNLAIAMASADLLVQPMILDTGRETPEPTEAGRRALDAAGGNFGTADTPIPRAVGAHLPLDVLLGGAPLLGHVNADPDDEGSFRHAPLFVQYGGRLYPSLGLQMALHLLGAQADQVVVVPGEQVTVSVPGRDPIRIPIDERARMRVNFEYGPGAVPAYQYTQLPEGDFDGRIVFIGLNATGLQDVVVTPVDRRTPGFFVHAVVCDNILNARFVEPAPVALEWAVSLAVAFAIAFAAGIFPRPAGIPLATLALAGPFVAAAWLFDGSRIWAPPGGAFACLLLTGAGVSVVRTVLEAREKARLRRIYERYLAPSVLDQVIRNPEMLQLGGRRMELTMFFSDIRGFTSYSEAQEPEELTRDLNEYFTRMTGIIHRHEGTLDKFVGDCVMVFFGDPVPQEDHAKRAVRMALEMREAMTALKADWTAQGRRTFDIGMGIHTGHVTVGNFGSETFTDYTVIGNAVNLAARIEAGSGAGQIRISARTEALVRDVVETRSLGRETFKGVSEPVEVFEVVGVRG